MEDKICDKCGSYDVHFVKYRMSNDVEILRKQCISCGKLLSKGYKKTYVKNFNSLPEMNIKARQENTDKQSLKNNIKLEFFKYAQSHFLRQLNYYNNVYLKSEEWRVKRNYIMSFYKEVCQKCNKKATDVHHLTYERMFKEKFEDLIPLCRKCHEEEHHINDNLNIDERIKTITNKKC